MEIITIFIIGVVTYLIYKFIQERSPESIIERLEKSAEFLRGQILENPLRPPVGISNEEAIKTIEKMEAKYIRVKERFKHDATTRIKLAQDWSDYVHAVWESFSARQLLNVDMEEDAIERFEERVKEPWIIQEEIEKRFNEMLRIKKK